VLSSTNNPVISKKLAYSHSASPAGPSTGLVHPVVAPPQSMFAHSFEFVAKPSETQRLQAAIPSALAGILKDVTGFAGCLVMTASLEARLVNVVTLWKGVDAHKRCAENVHWIQTILKPYMDHRLRLQTYLASVPGFAAAQSSPANAADPCFIDEQGCSQREEVCLA